MNAGIYKEIFKPDGGALLDIYVFGTTPKDWRAFWDYVSTHYKTTYLEDGRENPLPRFDQITDRHKVASISLQIHLSGVRVICHIFLLDRIEMDVLPEDVNTPEKAKSVFEFMLTIARLLDKEVFLTPEFAAGTEAERKHSALCSADSQSRSIRMARRSDGPI